MALKVEKWFAEVFSRRGYDLPNTTGSRRVSS